MKKSIEINQTNKRLNIDGVKPIKRELSANPHRNEEISTKKRIKNTQSNYSLYFFNPYLI